MIADNVAICPNCHDKDTFCEECNKRLEEERYIDDPAAREEEIEYERQQRLLQYRLVP